MEVKEHIAVKNLFILTKIKNTRDIVPKPH